MTSPFRHTTTAGSIVYAILLLLAGMFYLERTLFADASLLITKIVAESSLQIQCDRFGSAVTQVFPLIGRKMNWSLSAILMIYSLSFILYNLTLFLLITYLFKNKAFALVLLLTNLLLVNDTFYWIVPEYLQGVSFLIFFYAAIYRCREVTRYHWYALPVLTLAIATALYFHPLMLIPYLAVWSFLFLHDKGFRNYWHYALLGIAIGVHFVQPYLTPPEAYDVEKMQNVKNISLPNLIHFFSLQGIRNFGSYIVQDYFWLPILFGGLVVFYYRNRQWAKLAWLIAVIPGYIVLIHLLFKDGGEKLYMEEFYVVLGLFLALPLVLDVIPNVRLVQKYLLVFIAIIALTRIGMIYQSHYHYTRRLEANKKLITDLRKIEGRRFYMDPNSFNTKRYHFTWGLSYESLLLSSLESPSQSLTFFAHEDPKLTAKQVQETDNFICIEKSRPNGYLPERYFNLGTGKYRKVVIENEVPKVVE